MTNNKLINVAIFNRYFLKQHLTVGKNICLIGKYNIEKNNFIATNILLHPITSSIIEPVYHSNMSLKTTALSKIINDILSKIEYKNTFMYCYIKSK